MKSIVIIGADWRFRALLRAQLLEEDFRVCAARNVHELAEMVNPRSARPALIVAELGDSGIPEDEVNELLSWANLATLWLVAPRKTTTLSASEGRLRDSAERLFSRPIDLGTFTELIKKRLIG